MKQILLVLTVFCASAFAPAQEPTDCQTNTRCRCEADWDYYAPDCSDPCWSSVSCLECVPAAVNNGCCKDTTHEPLECLSESNCKGEPTILVLAESWCSYGVYGVGNDCVQGDVGTKSGSKAFRLDADTQQCGADPLEIYVLCPGVSLEDCPPETGSGGNGEGAAHLVAKCNAGQCD